MDNWGKQETVSAFEFSKGKHQKSDGKYAFFIIYLKINLQWSQRPLKLVFEKTFNKYYSNIRVMCDNISH